MQCRNEKKLLILSDGKPGHVNQSIAFARLLGCDYTICRVALTGRISKVLTYIFDRMGIYVPALFTVLDPLPEGCVAVVSAGSSTYYANRAVGRTLSAPSVAIMYPGGYSPGFDLIIAQEHDAPPQRDNIVTIPVNLSAPQPQGLVKRMEGVTTVAVIIGGA
ncbi:MAG TPA: ELM1/GtrOC1 family putative glycosyltransferase, partial [Geobacteraceae bacterium]|nr:ELM1/GtrOC1 family putative glycosyltransferase [Geobacteraceae bacterium]